MYTFLIKNVSFALHDVIFFKYLYNYVFKFEISSDCEIGLLLSVACTINILQSSYDIHHK
jgi:hypothetical protein